MKKFLKWTGITLGAFVLILLAVYLIYLRPFMLKMKQTELIQIDKDLLIVTGGGGNSGIINSDSLVIVIDTKMDEAAIALQKQVMALSGKKAVLVINTHWHPDHVDGNKLYTGATIMAGGSYTPNEWEKEAGKESMPNSWIKNQMLIPMGKDTLTVINLAHQVHTASDVLVYSHQRKLLFAGDVILNKQAPVLMGGADGDAYLEVLGSMTQKYDIQTIIPGHGAIGGIELIADFKEYFADMKLAAEQEDKEDELLAKYKDWNQLPVFMSPEATIKHFKKKAKQ